MSYTLNYTGSEIDDILDRAAPGGAIDQALATKQDALTFDAVPTEGSTNPAESGGIYDAIQAGGAAALGAYPTDSVSGDVVSFPDGADGIPVKSFVGSIIPIQDLHGQSAPYPAGGGKNILPTTVSNLKSINMGGTWSGNVYTLNGVTFTVTVDDGGNVTGVTVSGTSTAETAFNLVMTSTYESATILSGCPTGGSTSTYSLQALNSTSTSVLYNDTGSGASMASNTFGRIRIRIANGTAVSNIVFRPMIRLSSVSDATFAPYSNVCPISGWTEAEITHKGRNIYNPNASWSLSSAYRYVNGIVPKQVSARMVFKDKDTTVDVSGASIGFVYDDLGSTTPHTYRWVMQNGSIKADTTNIPNAGDTGVYCQNLMIYPRTAATYTAIFSRWDIMVEIGVESADYEPYTADTILLDFGQTVYAGTLTALGGGLWSVQPTHKAVTINDINWLYSAQNHFFYAEVTEMATAEDVMCSCYKYIGTKTDAQMSSADDYSIAVGPSSPYLKVKDTRYTTAASLKADMGAETILYPLADASKPDPIIVSGSDLATVLGSNTVWTDVGAVTELEYRADTALYVQKLLNGGGTLQTLSMASPSPSLSLGRVGVLAEPEASEQEQTEEEAEQLEQTGEPEQTEEA